MKTTYDTFRIMFIMLVALQPVFLFSQSNQYLHFDRENDYVQLDEGGQYVTGTNALSITGWFYCDQLAYGQGYMGFRSGSGDGEFYLIQLNDGKMECRLKSTTGLHEYVTPANTLIPQIWQHIAWIYNGSSVSFYMNGTLVGSSSASGTFSNADVPFAIGISPLGGFNFVYGGRIDEVSVWDKALTQTEIQDIINNELTGTEANLQMYYKFNQGEPGGNNTSITHLICEIGNGERDAELFNFALVGETSNFNGTLNPGYQAISFPQIPNHLTIDDPFEIEATATSGLPVEFEVLSGPATVAGNIVTLTGAPGQVQIEATQPGNGQYDPAAPVVNTFQVIDPYANVPLVDARNPLSGDVYVPVMGPIQLAAIVSIDYPELFWVEDVTFEVNGETITPVPYPEDHYMGWWSPPSPGNYSITINSSNNFGAIANQVVNINIVQTASDMEALAVDKVWCNPSIPSVTVDAELPSFMGAFDQIIGTLEVTCPAAGGGCGEWDRVASVEARGHNGEWIEIIRYITPYGVPCSHSIDLTDYMSLLQGKISFRVNCATLDNGFDYSLILNYNEGTPLHNYGFVYEIWDDDYPFGDYAMMQPVDSYSFSFTENTVAAKLKLVSTGHGWGDLNSNNAAEFYEATHHIWINGTQTFEQHNWYDCNPNPDGCQPQNGTWYYDRAGWCPGAIAQWFDYDLTPYISQGSIDMDYVFYENYVDYCHPNHPACVTGVTCANCNDGFNPFLVVATNIVVFVDNPTTVGIADPGSGKETFIRMSPNPTTGLVKFTVICPDAPVDGMVNIVDLSGKLLEQFNLVGVATTIDLSSYSNGAYIVTVRANGKVETQRLIIQK
ncbi:MAG: T9SS type A sorting domain-containing protein [Bacteroidales bacterium]|nr:T9SS type A sorting domain-containing protein [Bacteroidales bacterium]